MRPALLAASGLLFFTLLVVGWKQLHQPQPLALTPTLTGQVEYCLTCHSDLPEISPSHPVSAFGCVLCHGGERLSLEAGLAHSTLRGGKNPSDLAIVESSCGGSNCHSGSAQANRDHIQRVRTSLQATYAGAIANMRYTFGAQPDLVARQGIYAVQAPDSNTGIQALTAFDPAQEKNPALQAFGANCLSCHLSAEARPGPEYARFTGCAACHTPPSPPAPPPQAGGGGGRSERNIVHRLTTAIPYSQCNTCHNRGNYDLRAMQFRPRPDQPVDRLHDYYQPIAEFTRCEWTLDCIDCHTRQEGMGDGNLYSSKKEIQYIRCRTCHGTLTELPQTYTIRQYTDAPASPPAPLVESTRLQITGEGGGREGALALRLALLNPALDLKVGDTILITAQGEPLWNVRQLADGTFELFGKANSRRFTFRPVKGSACQQNPDEQESRSCHACHAEKR